MGCKDIGIRKSEFVPKTQFLWINFPEVELKVFVHGNPNNNDTYNTDENKTVNTDKELLIDQDDNDLLRRQNENLLRKQNHQTLENQLNQLKQRESKWKKSLLGDS